MWRHELEFQELSATRCVKRQSRANRKGTMDSQSLVQDKIAGQVTGRSIPSRSDDIVPLAWAEPSIMLSRSHARRNPLPSAVRDPLLPENEIFGRVFLNKTPSQANLSDGRSWWVIPLQQESNGQARV